MMKRGGVRRRSMGAVLVVVLGAISISVALVDRAVARAADARTEAAVLCVTRVGQVRVVAEKCGASEKKLSVTRYDAFVRKNEKYKTQFQNFQAKANQDQQALAQVLKTLSELREQGLASKAGLASGKTTWNARTKRLSVG